MNRVLQESPTSEVEVALNERTNMLFLKMNPLTN